METKRPENVQVASVIVELKDRGCRDDVLKLAKEDLEQIGRASCRERV